MGRGPSPRTACVESDSDSDKSVRGAIVTVESGAPSLPSSGGGCRSDGSSSCCCIEVGGSGDDSGSGCGGGCCSCGCACGCRSASDSSSCCNSGCGCGCGCGTRDGCCSTANPNPVATTASGVASLRSPLLLEVETKAPTSGVVSTPLDMKSPNGADSGGGALSSRHGSSNQYTVHCWR